ncbi:MAG: sulfurtransferase complex subunit TusB [Thermodesulfovibrionia bacterium]|nr:sulfurtransferase complex subunit TusB [Thermodesulfovibrionia bacterium]MCK5512573.1 sulfurtransferase complex subunit TusB [Thermodesulfovibrionia bacterium]
MKLAVFVSDYRNTVETLERLKPEKLGIILVGNGVYHATVKEKGNASPLLEKSADFYALSEDLETRGLSSSHVNSKVKVVNYGDVVDLLFNNYEKTAWL